MNETARRVHLHDRAPHPFRPIRQRGLTARDRVMMPPNGPMWPLRAAPRLRTGNRAARAVHRKWADIR